ncbi:hypothetical protein QBC42DRAFT_263453 [Cladorrhinum samala]|uniref:Uncharacterized protein n=1 Tax=Cladorrhinum samala TaxID=585594 RepID=A0AAV9HUB5_9PEZI|nr:hypothetical protein QBC42DRAFT_263453 [Cladorrhinum samala]
MGFEKILANGQFFKLLNNFFFKKKVGWLTNGSVMVTSLPFSFLWIFFFLSLWFMMMMADPLKKRQLVLVLVLCACCSVILGQVKPPAGTKARCSTHIFFFFFFWLHGFYHIERVTSESLIFFFLCYRNR